MNMKEKGKRKKELNKSLQIWSNLKIDFTFLRQKDMSELLKKIKTFRRDGGL